MLDYPLNASVRIPVRLFNSNGIPVAGVSSGTVSVTVEKANGTIVPVTIDGVNNTWTELTTGAFAGLGKYDLVVAGSFADVLGPMVIAITGGSGTSVALIQIVSLADTVPPTVSNYSPTPGSTIGPNTPITFDVTDTTNPIRRLLVAVLYSQTGQTDLVYDGLSFRGDYVALSSVTTITNGVHISIRKASNWPSTPTVEIYPIDVAGNEG